MSLLCRVAAAHGGAGGDYERLEFLGDGILKFLAVDYLYCDNPDSDEG